MGTVHDIRYERLLTEHPPDSSSTHDLASAPPPEPVAPLRCPEDKDNAPTAGAAAPPPHRSRRTHHWEYVDLPGTWDWEQQWFSQWPYVKGSFGNILWSYNKDLTRIIKVKPLRGGKKCLGYSSSNCSHDKNDHVVY